MHRTTRLSRKQLKITLLAVFAASYSLLFVPLVALAIGVGCQGAAPAPPPAADGKCLVDFYVGTRAKNQTCIHQGYTWSCINDGNDFTCQRGLEAKGELGAGAGSAR